jgi:leader peptidase (prepilin peptidase)/N-methyltransferase
MNAAGLFSVILFMLLGAIAWIDFRKLTIPNALNLLLAGTGLAYQWTVSESSALTHLAAGATVCAAFWTIRRLHSSITGRVGLGLGDVKMAGAGAIWLNPLDLPLFIFEASAAALVYTLSRQLSGAGVSLNARQPFGPFIAIGLLLTWLGEWRLLL